MTLPTTGALIATKNRVLGPGALAATTGTFLTPIEHLAVMQAPVPFAAITPDSGEVEFEFEAQDSEGDPESFDIDVIALLAPQLPTGAVVKFLDGTTELASVTWDPTAGRDQHLVAVLDQTVTLDTLTVNITDAGSDEIQIAGLWVSESFRHPFGLDDFARLPISYSEVSQVAATPWTNGRATIEEVRFSLLGMTETQNDAWRALCRSTGTQDPVLIVPLIRRPHDATYGTISEFDPGIPQGKGYWRAGATALGMV